MNGNNQHQLSGSRRAFFTKSAVLFGAGALAAKIVTAQMTTPVSTAITDIDILNYALALEHLEAAFYVNGISRFTPGQYADGTYTQVFGTAVNANVVSYLQSIRDHEVTHVTALTATIRQLGGIPVAPCVYNFAIANVNDFLSVAMALENTGVMAYDGALAMIASPDLKQVAATIATVEARHASYLNVLNGEIPFPSAFDTPKSRTEILAIAGQFITSCPGGGPTSNPIGPTITGLRSSMTTIDFYFR